MNFNLLPVTKNLIIINVLIYFATMMWDPTPGIQTMADLTSVYDLGRGSLAAFLPTSPLFQPFQLVTNMFMHSGFGHLFFNMLMMFFFGSLVEASMGSKRFLKFYLIAGFGALATYYLMAYLIDPNPAGSVLGASGAIYGVLLAYAYIAPDQKIQLLIPPIPIKVKYFVTGIILLDLFGGVSGGSTTAHFSHIGGGLVGLAMCFFWSQRGGLHE